MRQFPPSQQGNAPWLTVQTRFERSSLCLKTTTLTIYNTVQHKEFAEALGSIRCLEASRIEKLQNCAHKKINISRYPSNNLSHLRIDFKKEKNNRRSKD
jgi:hypothetical protein